jgi:WD40 repeat protein
MIKFALSLFVLLNCYSMVVAQEVKLVATIKHERTGNFPSGVMLDLTPDGKYLATKINNGEVKVWETVTGKFVRTLNEGIESRDYFYGRISFTRDGNFLVIPDGEINSKVIDFETGTLVETLEGPFYAMVSPDGRYFVSATFDRKKITNTIQLRETASWKILWSVTVPFSQNDGPPMGFSPDGKYFFVVERNIRVWESASGKLVGNVYANYSSTAEFLPNSKQILMAGTMGAKIITPAGAPVRTLYASAESVRDAKVSPDGKHAVISGSFGLELREVATAKRIWLNDDAQSGDIRISPDGKYAVTTGSYFPSIWETATGKLVRELTENDGSFRADNILFTPDGKYLLTSMSFGNIVNIWELTNVVVIPKPTAPPSVIVSSIELSDANGDANNILDGNEKAEIKLKLSNSGKGKAYNLIADIKAISVITGIELPKQFAIGDLAPGESKTVSLPISASMQVESGAKELEIVLKEGNGFDSDPVRVSFTVQKFKNPAVAIADHKFSTDGDRVKLNLPISIEIILQNRGQGDATNIKVTFSNPANVFAGSGTNFSVDLLKPNESRNISYSFFANKSYTGKDIPIEVTVTEKYNKYGDKQTFKVSLAENLAETQVVTIAGKSEKDVQIDNVTLRPVVTATPTVDESAKSISAGGVPTYYSLFIGVEKYQYSSAGLSNLDKPVNDATQLRNALLTGYVFPEDKSTFLKNPTRSEIIKALETLGRKLTAKDNLLIFYAGHGYWDEQLEIGYWIPSDGRPLDDDDKSNWISNSTIRDYIKGIKSRHTLLITDACFGGGIFKTRDMSSELTASSMSGIYKLTSRKAMTSGTLTTVPDESAFMKFLVKRLTENTSEYLSARQVFYSIETPTMNMTNTVPQYGVIQGTDDEGGDFVFIKKQ